MTSPNPEARAPLTGIWLSAESVQTPIETLVIDMLASNLASRVLREAELEELRRGVKLADVALSISGSGQSASMETAKSLSRSSRPNLRATRGGRRWSCPKATAPSAS